MHLIAFGGNNVFLKVSPKHDHECFVICEVEKLEEEKIMQFNTGYRPCGAIGQELRQPVDHHLAAAFLPASEAELVAVISLHQRAAVGEQVTQEEWLAGLFACRNRRSWHEWRVRNEVLENLPHQAKADGIKEHELLEKALEAAEYSCGEDANWMLDPDIIPNEAWMTLV